MLQDRNNQTTIHLLFQNREPRDILLRNELEEYAKRFPTKFFVGLFVTHPSAAKWAPEICLDLDHLRENVAYFATYIRPKHLEFLLSSVACEMLYICGPDGWVDSMKQICKEIGLFGSKMHVF